MGRLPDPVQSTLKQIGTEREQGEWRCPFCSGAVISGDLVGEEFACRVCCGRMDQELKRWGVWDLLRRLRRGKEQLVQKAVPGVTARRVAEGSWKVAGPLKTEPVSKGDVESFIDQHHRHHGSPHSAILGVKCVEGVWSGDDEMRGAATLATPTARKLMEAGTHLEVNRICVCGPKWRRLNAVSKMTGELRRQARRLRREAQEKLDGPFRTEKAKKKAVRRAGVGRLRTYILERESGDSLRAAGWSLVGRSNGGSWANSRDGRRQNPATEGPKWIFDTRI